LLAEREGPQPFPSKEAGNNLFGTVIGNDPVPAHIAIEGGGDFANTRPTEKGLDGLLTLTVRGESLQARQELRR
jgi:hypothetical protein